MHSDELSERAITSLKGIGPARAEQFARMGLFSLRDLLGFNSSVRQEQYAQKTERL